MISFGRAVYVFAGTRNYGLSDGLALQIAIMKLFEEFVYISSEPCYFYNASPISS